MSSLKAATVSNRIIKRKRRRTGSDVEERDGIPPTDPADPTDAASPKADDGGTSVEGRSEEAVVGTTAPDRQKKKKAAKSTQAVECLIDWPPRFTELEKTHRALNLVYTFCSTRKHLATTFDTIRSAVESHTKRELTIEDVAAIVAIRPEGIYFGYVDEVMLQIDVRGAERDTMFKSSRSKHIATQGPAPDASVGGLTGLDDLGSRHPDDLPPKGSEVLFFEFVDGDLKRQVQNRKSGEPVNPSRRLRDEDLKMPVYSQKQMTTLIEKRNQKFSNAISAFINRCVQENLDPEVMLCQEAEACIPAPSEPEPVTSNSALSIIPQSIPKERKSIPEIIQELKASPWYTGQIVPDGHRVFDAQDPVYGELDFLLSQDMVNALYNAKGIIQFYAHQAEAINSLQTGHHVVVSTSTSSGKSLIYQLPVLHALEQDPDTCAMYIFPTKALAQDQKRSLKDMLGYLPGLEHILVETFDGDTPMHERNQIRDEARIIFTNPDMLHITILPQEDRWRTFLRNLRYVVGELFPCSWRSASLITLSS